DRGAALGHAGASDFAQQIRGQMARYSGRRHSRIDRLLSKLKSAVDQKDWEAAINAGEQVLKLDPSVPTALALTALAHKSRASLAARNQQHQLSVQSYSRSLELNPDADTYFRRAMVYAAMEQYSEAVSDLGRAIEENSSEPEYYFCRGNARLLKGEPSAALLDLS